jgi:hypothetical protein
VEKMLKLAEEAPEPDADGADSRAQSPSPSAALPSTAMERLLAEGVSLLSVEIFVS